METESSLGGILLLLFLVAALLIVDLVLTLVRAWRKTSPLTKAEMNALFRDEDAKHKLARGLRQSNAWFEAPKPKRTRTPPPGRNVMK